MSENEYQFCSWCYKKTTHRLVKKNWATKNDYECMNCHNFTVMCRVPNCHHMATSRPAKLKAETKLDKIKENWSSEFCAEHDGTIADFNKLSMKIPQLDEFKPLFKRDKFNMARGGKITAGALTCAGVVALTMTTGGGGAAAAAAAGHLGLLGAAGTGTAISSLSGAALTSASLAAIGGSVAAGTAIITAGGAALGGYLGGVASNSYVGEDKYFDFYYLQRGEPTKTIFINGFLQQMDKQFDDWVTPHFNIFPKEGIYGLTWGSKDLVELGTILEKGITKEAAKRLFIKIGKKGSKKFNPLGPVFSLLGVLDNPWHVSIVRAAKTGVLLADAVSRSTEKEYSLVGHSLGCRVIYYALQALSTNEKQIKIKDVILLGGAVGRNDEKGWGKACSAISGNIYNCYSQHDAILSKLYKTANANLSDPIGIGPIPISKSNLKNLDCSDFVSGHMKWKDEYKKVLRMIY